MTCMKVVALTETTFVARGVRYIPQSASLLKYLSMPVMMGPTPKPILSAHRPTLRRLSKSVIPCPLPKRAASRRLDTGIDTFPEKSALERQPTLSPLLSRLRRFAQIYDWL